MSTSYRLGELAERVGCEVRGNPERRIRGISTLDAAGPEELSFLTHPRYRAAAAATRAGAVLVGPKTKLEGRDLLCAAEPQLALAALLELFHPAAPHRGGISKDARVGDSVSLGADVQVDAFAVICDRTVLGRGVRVGAGCVVGEDCQVGDDSELKPRVVLYPGTRLGARCLVHAGVVLGADGFGFATSGGRHRKIPQVGHVFVEDDVEIGANSTVDRAALGETRIGSGTKIDDLVMIAHGVQVGNDSLLAAQAGVAGSSRLGARTTMAGQSGAAGHLEIGEGVIVAAKSAVFEDLPNGAFVAGIPAVEHRRWKRSQSLIRKLPELRKQVRELEARLAELERRAERTD